MAIRAAHIVNRGEEFAPVSLLRAEAFDLVDDEKLVLRLVVAQGVNLVSNIHQSVPGVGALNHGWADEAHLVVRLLGLLVHLQSNLASTLHIAARDGDGVVGLGVESICHRLSGLEHSWLLLLVPLLDAQLSESALVIDFVVHQAPAGDGEVLDSKLGGVLVMI